MIPIKQVIVLESLLGNTTTEKVLWCLLVRHEGYAREMSRVFDLPVSVIQKQLARLERGGIVVSRMVGRTRMFTLNPTYPFIRELENLLRRALEFLPPADRAPYEPNRRRPRAAGKRL